MLRLLSPNKRAQVAQYSTIWSGVSLALGLLLCALGCQEAKLVISEVSFPQVSSDAQGPYLVLVRTSGTVNELKAEWSREAPEDSPEEARLDELINQQGMTSGTFDGELWTVRLPGGVGVADYRFTLIASNATSSARYPSEGEVGFKVRALNGRCSSDGQCLPGEVCHRTEGYCFSPPEPCERDLHCPRDQFCNTETGACRFYDSACEDDDGCAAGYLCQEGACVLPCEGRCGGGYICEGTSCVAPPCEGASDCPLELPLCDEGRCAPAPSSCEPACGEGERCVLGSCEPAPCGDGGPCQEGTLCVEGECVGCRADGQCGPGRRCDINAGRCVEGERAWLCAPCHEAIDGVVGCGDTLVCLDTYPGCRLPCGGDEDCQDGFCEGGACVSFNGEPCDTSACAFDEDCGATQVCLAGHCLSGQQCAIDADCVADMRCGERGLCTTRAPCDPNWGQRCASGEVCVAGRCEAAREPLPSDCSVSCNTDLDCGPQQICGYFGPDYSICASLCDTSCAGGDFCEPLSQLTSVCMPSPDECNGEPSCGWDEWEPNSSPESATLILGNGLDGWVCSSDQDWLEFLEVTFEAQWGFTDSDWIIVEFYDEAFNLMDLVEVFEGEVFLVPDGVKWMNVTSFEPFESYYNISRTFAQPCEPDLFESNDELSEAYPIGNGAEISATACNGDLDWYEVPANGRSSELFATLSTFGESLWYLGIYDERGLPLTEITTDESEVWLATPQGSQESLYIQVQCISNCASSSYYYELSVEVF